MRLNVVRICQYSNEISGSIFRFAHRNPFRARSFSSQAKSDFDSIIGLKGMIWHKSVSKYIQYHIIYYDVGAEEKERLRIRAIRNK